MCCAGFCDLAPRIPPREPLAVSAGPNQWPRDQWPPRDDVTARYITEDAPQPRYVSVDALNSSKRGTKGLKVRFSFDNGSESQSQNSIYGQSPKLSSFGPQNGVGLSSFQGSEGPNSSSTPVTESPPQGRQFTKYPPFTAGQQPSQTQAPTPHPRLQPINSTYGANPASTSSTFPTSASGSSFPPPPKQGQRREVHLDPDSLYPTRQSEHFPRKHLNMQGKNYPHRSWDARDVRGKGRNNESLSSLPQSVDDDGSTTTSGSYSIDFEDVANTSLEC